MIPMMSIISVAAHSKTAQRTCLRFAAGAVLWFACVWITVKGLGWHSHYHRSNASYLHIWLLFVIAAAWGALYLAIIVLLYLMQDYVSFICIGSGDLVIALAKVFPISALACIVSGAWMYLPVVPVALSCWLCNFRPRFETQIQCSNTSFGTWLSTS
jgi:hypothetical protein